MDSSNRGVLAGICTMIIGVSLIVTGQYNSRKKMNEIENRYQKIVENYKSKSLVKDEISRDYNLLNSLYYPQINSILEAKSDLEKKLHETETEVKNIKESELFRNYEKEVKQENYSLKRYLILVGAISLMSVRAISLMSVGTLVFKERYNMKKSLKEMNKLKVIR